MDCVACGDKMLQRHPEGIEIDVCRRCRGVWLDASELDGLLGVETGHSIEAGLDESAQLPLRCRYCGDEPGRGTVCEKCDQPLGLKCPRDQRQMYIVEVAGLQLDRCPTCKGVWVDGFERTRLSRMRETLAAINVDKHQGAGGGETAALIGMMAAGGGLFGQGDEDISSVFGFDGDQSSLAEDSEAEVDSDNKETASPDVSDERSMREYIEEYGNFEIECEGCAESLTRYTAWEIEEEFLCFKCAKAQGKGLDTHKISNAYATRAAAEEYWTDEKHLTDALLWVIGGMFRWRKKE